ncbi:MULTISPECIES: NAD(P)H-hydrate dehydratase [Paenibacillus]|uniref:NAD(P)H-hydrate dehydratase n=1 Tax=Paenibacillus polymyxa TaxID=1406 RepID=UPI00129A86F3|nr:NAD(P)H-hydrate dehydratase [Paenibacillus polymyxa]KAE8560759.1 bifunctional ADP-dependent (S)-NAD(P)H-hydrate dehydratase/NAD(P)H-hydrate epimerase [Paenibacillus polymyxa]MCJ1223191.1 NAD(P)H-hydrate dehydratase [Paenibacillus polymyxa]
MYMVTAEQMRQLDRYTIDKLGIPALILMENAGRAIADEVLKLCAERRETSDGINVVTHTGPGDVPRHGGVIRTDSSSGGQYDVRERAHWYILVGKGNNGGDGLVAARHLTDAGLRVTVVYAEPPAKLRGEAAAQRDIIAALDIPVILYGRDNLDLRGASGIVDALLGTGTQGPPREPYASLIREANASGAPIVSVDVPSGLDADTGALHEPCIHARVTVCLAYLKCGLAQYPGAGNAGDVVVRYIGIPPGLARERGVQLRLLTSDTLRDALDVDVSRSRVPDGHKGTYGHVLVAGGSLRMSGAGLLAARAALRIGSGLVTWAVPEALLPRVIGAAPELMLAAAATGSDGEWNADSADELLELAQTRDVLAVGPGLGRFAGDTGWLRRLWEEYSGPLVLDADALNILASAGPELDAWKSRDAAIVLTPHPGEMARLLGISTGEVQRDRITHAREYARTRGVTLVLKGARTVIACPDGTTYVNTTGHAGMATGGAGDVLTGIIAGLLAQGLNASQAAAFGVYLHGAAGELAARHRQHPASVVAGDIIEAL